MSKRVLVAGILVGAVAVLIYAVGLGVYAASSTAPPIPTQPETADEADRVVARMGLAKAYPFPHRFLQTPNGRMHYVELGSGPTLLCLHGNPTWSFLYRHVIAHLSDRARVVAPDLIGFGLSEKHPDPEAYTLGGHVDDVSALVENADLRDVVLVLHDWGAAVGLGVAARHPQRVRAIVVMNGLSVSPDGDRAGRAPPAVRLARVPVVGEELVQGLAVLHRVGIPAGLARERRRARDVARAYRIVQASWEERAGALAFPRLLHDRRAEAVQRLLAEEERYLRSFHGPVLLLWGLEDRELGADALEAWRGIVPHARVIEIPDAGHLLPEDAADEVVAHLREFLAALER